MSQEHILVVDDNEMVTQMMRILLSRLGYSVTLHTNPVEALNWLRMPGNLPNLIMSDVMMPEMSGQEFIRCIRSDALLAHLPIILLTASKDMDEKIAGFQAGTDDYLVKPIDPTELELRVKALLARTKAAPVPTTKNEGKVITVFSLRGGVGTSSMAVNLSVALAYLWKTQVPLVDLALKNGHCALMLNMKPKYTMSNLVEWETTQVETEIIDKLLLTHETGIKLLPAPISPAEAELITPEIVDRFWSYLRASYPLIVIDGGSQLVEPMLTVLERSETIILMLTPELASLKVAVDAIQLFEQLGINMQQVMPVINWTFPHNGLPQKNIETALKHKMAGVIPYDTNAFVQAINSGRPLVEANPTSQISLAFTTLAYKLSATQMEAKQASDPSKLLTWVRRLAQAA